MGDDGPDGPEAADPAGNERDSGLTVAAHEIRAPLLAVKAALESALAGGDGVDARHLLEGSLAEVERLAATIDDLLRWAVAEPPLRRRPTDLVALVTALVDRSALDPTGDRVVAQPSEPVVADVDPGQLGLALANLVRNGLAYGEPNSTVEVSVRAEEGGEIEITVKSHGSLGSGADDDSLFLPGTRRDTLGRNPGGRGFGLFIAKRVVEAHGGHLWHESTERETTFHVRLELPS